MHLGLKIVVVVAIGFGMCTASVHADGGFKVGAVEAGPGVKATGYIEVKALKDEAGRIPVTVIRGLEAGPTLALIAGTHGYEYAPIIALQHVAQKIDPATLKGTVIIVHVANVPSFLGRTIYYSPVDKLNLNRAYPGKADGSLTERIAYAITTQVIEQADYVVDMHGGDGNESLRPYIYMPKTGDEKLDAAILGMAQAFGTDHIVIDTSRVTAPDKSVYTDMTALARGIPAMTTEVGGMGSTDAVWVDKNIQGAMNLLRHLGMTPGDANPAEPIVWLEDYAVVASPATGIFKPSVEAGYMVTKGGVLGELVDFFGEHLATIRAPFTGILNYVVKTPPVSKGEPLAMLSHVKAE